MTPQHLVGSTALVRAVGRWDLTAQVVNIIMGASIFVLPGLTLQEMGGWAPLAVLVTAAGVFAILLGFVEAAGRYRDPGGMYRYAGDAFGEYVGVQVGLLYWVVRVTALAAVANVFATYLVELWPPAAKLGWRAVVLTLVVLGAGWINIRGVRQAASVLNLFALAKLVPLAILCGVGVLVVSPASLTTTPVPDSTSWARAILLWVFAFGGFEAILIPAGEARDPERDGPRALLQGVAIVTVFYALVQFVVGGALTGDVHGRPVGEAARVILGTWGALLVAVGALIATSGHIAGSILASSRITFAIAERGALPAALARVHPRFRTPAVSIGLFTLLSWILAVSGTFAWNASISAVARLIVYAMTSLAVLRLRRVGRSTFQAPAWAHLAAVGFCGWLFAHQTLGEAIAVGVVLGACSAVWLAYRLSYGRHPQPTGTVKAG